MLTYLKFISILTSVERRWYQLHTFFGFCLSNLSRKFAYFPDQGSRIIQWQSRQSTFKGGNLVLLLGHDTAHHLQMLLTILLQVLLHAVPRTFESTAGFLETATVHRNAAILFQVAFQFFASQYVYIASVGTLDGHSTTLEMVGCQSVRHKFFRAESTG